MVFFSIHWAGIHTIAIYFGPSLFQDSEGTTITSAKTISNMKAELIFMGMKQQKFKMANSKIVNSANSQCFLQNFYGLILWQLNKFMQRTAIWLNLYGCHGVLCKVKKHKCQGAIHKRHRNILWGRGVSNSDVSRFWNVEL